jgi:hypothetical protein
MLTEVTETVASTISLTGTGTWARLRTTCFTIWALLLVIMTTVTWHPVLRALERVPIDYNEGWNSYRQHWAASGLSLYDKPPNLFVTNYPPISFYLVGFLSVHASSMAAGRGIAFFSLILTCVLAGAITRSMTGHNYSAVYTGLCLWCWVAVYVPWRVGVNEPQFLATVFVLIGVYSYTKRTNGGANLVLVALFFSLGVFTKQTVIAFPMAIILHICFQRRLRDLMIIAVSGSTFSGIIIALVLSTGGIEFFSNLLCPRAFLLSEGIQNVFLYICVFAAPILLTIIQIKSLPRSSQRTLLSLVLALANIISMIFAMGDGVGQNIFTDALIILAIWCGIGFQRFVCSEMNEVRARTACFALIPLLPAILLIPQRLTSDFVEVGKSNVVLTDYLTDVAFLSSLNDPVICEDIQMCYDAGKRMFFDPYFVLDQIKLGHITEAQVQGLLEEKALTAVEIEIPQNDKTITGTNRNRFSEGFIKTMRRNYVPVRSGGGFAIFVPRP